MLAISLNTHEFFKQSEPPGENPGQESAFEKYALLRNLDLHVTIVA